MNLFWYSALYGILAASIRADEGDWVVAGLWLSFGAVCAHRAWVERARGGPPSA